MSNRLRRLEERAGRAIEENAEERIRREALRRTTTEDLWLVNAWLERTLETGEDPTEEEMAAILRYQELEEEVRRSS
jgi:hypothetical protein